MRFVKNLKQKVKGGRLELETLTGDELHAGETHLYKSAQNAKYGKEIFVLRQTTTPTLAADKNMTFSHINTWNPYIDNEGLLRSRGQERPVDSQTRSE
ncbi:uncharacterized protein LOC101465727 [Anopheles sinensis]|uniref:Uncharacterized protein LOC101465727 n=1 Tax=Anopheles sinensis TaxID=74873 RepID=A0A084W0N7_ANOSI|nr:uncharacterized protein LOC101465727 [Anopheles sinensis]